MHIFQYSAPNVTCVPLLTITDVYLSSVYMFCDDIEQENFLFHPPAFYISGREKQLVIFFETENKEAVMCLRHLLIFQKSTLRLTWWYLQFWCVYFSSHYEKYFPLFLNILIPKDSLNHSWGMNHSKVKAAN